MNKDAQEDTIISIFNKGLDDFLTSCNLTQLRKHADT